MTMDEHWRCMDKCKTEANRCIDLAVRSKRGYEYWKQRKGIKSIINQKVFLTVNKLACKLANSWIKEDAKHCLEVMNELSKGKES